MLKEFNLLATTSRGYEGYARSELRYLLESVGDPAATVERAGISGLLVIKTALDPFVVTEKSREILHERPYELRYTLRLIPIERVVRTDMGQIQTAAAELGSKIGENETFRITVEKRFTMMSSKEIIEMLAANIKRKVNLSKPDKILLVEIIGGLTGVSVVNAAGILSVLKEKIL